MPPRSPPGKGAERRRDSHAPDAGALWPCSLDAAIPNADRDQNPAGSVRAGAVRNPIQAHPPHTSPDKPKSALTDSLTDS